MEIQTNHTVRILNAKCEYVLAVDNLVKKLDYGDDIECCLNKLFLASKLINRLECYCFEDRTLADTEVLSTFTIDISNDLSDSETYSLAVNGSYLAICGALFCSCSYRPRQCALRTGGGTLAVSMSSSLPVLPH